MIMMMMTMMTIKSSLKILADHRSMLPAAHLSKPESQNECHGGTENPGDTEWADYWLLLRGSIVQSVTFNCDHLLIYCASHLSSNHSRLIHQNSLLSLQQTHLVAKGEKIGEK
jgi:hypothetical protein